MGFSRQEYWSGLPFPSPGDLQVQSKWIIGTVPLGHVQSLLDKNDGSFQLTSPLLGLPL